MGGAEASLEATTGRFALVAIALLLTGCSVPKLQEHAYPSWGFAVSFRSPPIETDYPATGDGVHRHAFLVESVAAGRDDLVEVIDGRGSAKSAAQALEDAPGSLARSVGGALGPMTYAAAGPVVGREFLLRRAGRPTAKVRVFVANQRLYEVISESPLGPSDPTVNEFLDSFRFTGPAPTAA